MADQKPAAPSRVPRTAGALALLVGAAVVAVSPFTGAREGTRYVAYQDGGGVWTECRGHTAGVKKGDTATEAQCAAYYRADMTAHMVAAISAVPNLVDHPGPLKAAGDFAFNAGDARFAGSPMAAKFAIDDWRGGCEAFRGYITLYRAPKPVPGGKCRISKLNGKLYCEAKGLVTRREGERAMCLAELG